jgi:predicted DNA-binding transcriptional regulator AlpA
MRRARTEDPILVDIHGIAAMLQISSRTAHRVVREPGFPPPVRLRACIRWWRSDVLEHVRGMTGVEPLAKASS